MMTLQLSFTCLEQAAEDTAATVAGLIWAINAVPEPEALHALLDKHQNSALQLEEMGEALVAVAARARQSAALPLEYQQVRRTLINCQQLYFDLSDALAQLDEAGARRDRLWLAADLPRWQPWTAGIADALGACAAPLYRLRQALFLCWQSLTEPLPARFRRAENRAP